MVQDVDRTSTGPIPNTEGFTAPHARDQHLSSKYAMVTHKALSSGVAMSLEGKRRQMNQFTHTAVFPPE